MLLGPDATPPRDSRRRSRATLGGGRLRPRRGASRRFSARCAPATGPTRFPPPHAELRHHRGRSAASSSPGASCPSSSRARSSWSRSSAPSPSRAAGTSTELTGSPAEAASAPRRQAPRSPSSITEEALVIPARVLPRSSPRVLFAIGGIGFLVRRNVLVAADEHRAHAQRGEPHARRVQPLPHHDDHTGQMFAFFVIAAAAAEAAVGLAIVLSLFRISRTVRSPTKPTCSRTEPSMEALSQAVPADDFSLLAVVLALPRSARS